MAFKEILLTTFAIATATFAIYMFNNQSPKNKNSLDSFLSFNRKFSKSHGSQSELEYRYSIYSDNLAFIAQRNSEVTGFTLGENAFTDLTFEEFSSKYLSQQIIPNEIFTEESEVSAVSGQKDWNKAGKVAPVKNQGACGSCWAFSAIGSLESAWAIKTGTVTLLSEMELVNCSSKYGNHGCNGGLMSMAFKYILANQIARSSDSPYRPVQGSCQADKSKPRFSMKSMNSISPVSVVGLAKALEINPVSVAIEVQRDFQMYQQGIYTGSKGCGRSLNHGVLAVGYSQTGSNDFFLVKNSWGEQWGEKGFVRMAFGTGSGTCGIANGAAVYPVV